jgi:hypothetical protein
MPRNALRGREAYSERFEPLEKPSLVFVERDLTSAGTEGAECRRGLIGVQLGLCRSPNVAGAKSLEPIPEGVLSSIDCTATLHEPQRIASNLNLIIPEDHDSEILTHAAARGVTAFACASIHECTPKKSSARRADS